MSLIAGNAECTTGLSKRIYDYLIDDARNGFSDPLTPAGAEMIQAICYAVARGVVDEIKNNAVVSVTISTATGGLQRTPSPNDPSTPTLGPTFTRFLPGIIT